MEIDGRTVGGVAVLDLAGALTVSASERELDSLRTAICRLTTCGSPAIGLNLSRLTHLDARGLGELVSSLNRVRASGGRLILVAPSPRVARLLATTRLDTVFECCESEADLV